MIEVRCHGCGETFQAKQSNARWCSSKCRMRVSRGSRPALTPVPDLPPDQQGVTRAVMAALEKAGECDTVNGALALLLARRIDADTDTAAGKATLARELQKVMEAVSRTGRVEGDFLDELRRRREAKLARADLGPDDPLPPEEPSS